MQYRSAPRSALLWVAVAISLTSCGGGGSNNVSPIAPESGFVTLGITDAPVDDAAEVIIVVTGIELQRGSASTININFDTPKSIDLLSYRDGRSFNLLEQHQVLPGNYEWLRLQLRTGLNLQDGSRIRLRDGRQFPLYIPSGFENGLKMNRPFTVAQGSTTRLMIDFDLRKSVVAPPGQESNWILRPTVRLVDMLEVGTVQGVVDIAALATNQQTTPSACKAGIYVFSGSDALPDDMDGNAADGADPLVYRPLVPAAPGAAATYTVHFVAAGDYTVAATCQFDVDADPARSEYTPAGTGGGLIQTMRFTVRNARVAKGGTTTVNLP